MLNDAEHNRIFVGATIAASQSLSVMNYDILQYETFLDCIEILCSRNSKSRIIMLRTKNIDKISRLIQQSLLSLYEV